MGSKSRGGGGGGQQASPTYSYGGTAGMTQPNANAAYQKDLAAWRAPTTSATMTPAIQKAPVAIPAMATAMGPTGGYQMAGSDGGPALPKLGVPLAAPMMDPRVNLARTINARDLPRGVGGHNRIDSSGREFSINNVGERQLRMRPGFGGGEREFNR